MDSPGDSTFETLSTILTIENLNSDNHSYLTINCDTRQHSQFLRCFYNSLYSVSWTLLIRLVFLWVGARGVEFDWRYRSFCLSFTLNTLCADISRRALKQISRFCTSSPSQPWSVSKNHVNPALSYSLGDRCGCGPREAQLTQEGSLEFFHWFWQWLATRCVVIWEGKTILPYIVGSYSGCSFKCDAAG